MDMGFRFLVTMGMLLPLAACDDSGLVRVRAASELRCTDSPIGR